MQVNGAIKGNMVFHVMKVCIGAGNCDRNNPKNWATMVSVGSLLLPAGVPLKFSKVSYPYVSLIEWFKINHSNDWKDIRTLELILFRVSYPVLWCDGGLWCDGRLWCGGRLWCDGGLWCACWGCGAAGALDAGGLLVCCLIGNKTEDI